MALYSIRLRIISRPNRAVLYLLLSLLFLRTSLLAQSQDSMQSGSIQKARAESIQVQSDTVTTRNQLTLDKIDWKVVFAALSLGFGLYQFWMRKRVTKETEKAKLIAADEFQQEKESEENKTAKQAYDVILKNELEL